MTGGLCPIPRGDQFAIVTCPIRLGYICCQASENRGTMSANEPPVICIVVKKRNPLVTLGRPQKYRWTAVNWDNKRKLATSGEAFTNGADALRNAVQLFADESVDLKLLDQAGYPSWFPLEGTPKPVGMFRPANVYLIQDGVSGMQVLRRNQAA